MPATPRPAYEIVIGTPERFHFGKQIASYVGLVPTEESSGDRRRLGHISKQGNISVRFFAGRSSAGYSTQSSGMAQQVLLSCDGARTEDRESSMARMLAVYLYWMWRRGLDHGQMQKLGSHAGQPGNRHGVPLNIE